MCSCLSKVPSLCASGLVRRPEQVQAVETQHGCCLVSCMNFGVMIGEVFGASVVDMEEADMSPPLV